MKRKNIIWNISRICPHNCAICCVDGFFISTKDEEIRIRSSNEFYKFRKESLHNIYDEANLFLQKNGLELTLTDKLKIIENIDIPIKLDISGGDPLILTENFKAIIDSSKKIGKKHISISTTGIGLSNTDLDFLSKYVENIEFTYDYPGDKIYFNRPRNYNGHNLRTIREMSKYGIKSIAQMSLTKENISESIIENIYNDLINSNVNELFLMKIFPVGRGGNNNINEPSREEYRNAITKFKELEGKYKFPKVVLQSILSEIHNSKPSHEEMYYISNSLNITNLGILTLSPWAYDPFGNPLPEYILGDLKEKKLSELYNSNSYNELFKKFNIVHK